MTAYLKSALVLLGLYLLTPALSRAAAESALALYEVPALSSIPRLPDELPSDAQPSRQLRMVSIDKVEWKRFVLSEFVSIAD